MSTLTLRHGAPRARTAKGLAYVAAMITLGLVGSAVARVSDAALVPIFGGFALVLALGLARYGVSTRTWTSPLMLMGVPLMLSFAAATTPITKILSDWSLGTLLVAALIVIAPLAGIFAAILATDGFVPTLARGTDAQPHPGRLVAACCVMYSAGAIVLATQFAHIGGPPLLSSNIDEARFTPVGTGLFQLLTDGLPLAMLIATWARVARPTRFSPVQRRVLELIIVSVPLMLALGGGRITVLLPIFAACVVSARYITAVSARRLLIVMPLVLVAFTSAVFLARHEQGPSRQTSQAILFNEGDQSRKSVLASSYAGLNITFGEQLRVVLELRNARVTTPPFTTSVYFTHRFNPRAVNAGTIASVYTGGWQASGYAGPLLLDFGLFPALLFGFALGAVAHFGYRRYARGRSVTVIWVYAYLASLIAMAFYDNIFLNYFYPLADVAVLAALSRMVIVCRAA